MLQFKLFILKLLAFRFTVNEEMISLGYTSFCNTLTVSLLHIVTVVITINYAK